MSKLFVFPVALFCSALLVAQTSSMTRTDLHDVHLMGESGAYNTAEDGNGTASVVFISYGLPGGVKSVVQANLGRPLGAVQAGLAKANNGHLTVDVTCPEFALLTIHGKTGKLTTTGTGRNCTVSSVR